MTSPRTQNDSRVRLVKRVSRGEGGQPGNQNALKAMTWENGFDLSKSSGIREFLAEVIRAVWEGRLGTRAASSLNGSLRLMFELCELPDLEKRIAELEKMKQN
ncbi:MAG: hypothetical protein ACLPY5_14175 [Candidatus Bathyarchaeia archaeon]